MSEEPNLRDILQSGHLAAVGLALASDREDLAHAMVGDTVHPETLFAALRALNQLAGMERMTGEEWVAVLVGRAEKAGFVEAGLRFAADPIGAPDAT